MRGEREEFDERKESYDRATRKPKTLKDIKYGLYDRIKVSVKVMDIIIYAVIALIVIALVAGIATGQ